MNIFLAGDSIVQNYSEEEFIAGWGQYIGRFFNPQVQVINYAKGGRSTRLFMNEGRFDDLMRNISKGDYLFIEFCHNDDASKTYHTMFNRLVELGAPNGDGIYPVIEGQPAAKNYLPKEYLDALYADPAIGDKQAVINSVLQMFASYPKDTYYPYSSDASKGSFKWFLKQYIGEACAREAIPVLITAPARTVFDNEGRLKDGPGLHGGNNFCYIRAVRQIAKETDTALLDLFDYSKSLYEKIGPEKIHGLTSIKQGVNKGNWPKDFDNEMNKPETVSEDTHFNKYGAYLLAKGLAQLIKDSADPRLTLLKAHIAPDFSTVTEAAPAILAPYIN